MSKFMKYISFMKPWNSNVHALCNETVNETLKYQTLWVKAVSMEP